MERTIVDALLQGPASTSLDDQFVWLYQMHRSCADSTQSGLRALAEPLQDALQLAKSAKDGRPPPDLDAQLALCLYRVHLHLLYSFLEELNRFRNAIAADVAKLKASNPHREKLVKVQATYETLITRLGKAYNELRGGNPLAFDDAKAILLEAQDAFSALRQ